MMIPLNWGRSQIPVQDSNALLRKFSDSFAICIVVTFLSALNAFADSVVTNCSHQALIAAINTGGTITFPSDCSMTLTNTITLAGNITLDSAGHHVTLNGNNNFRLLTIQPGAGVTLIGLTLAGGQHTNGGALFINSGATVVATCSWFAALGQQVFPRDKRTPEMLAAFPKTQIVKWWPIAKAASIKGG